MENQSFNSVESGTTNTGNMPKNSSKLNTILIVNRVNRNVKVNGMKNSCNMFINSIHWPGEIHL